MFCKGMSGKDGEEGKGEIGGGRIEVCFGSNNFSRDGLSCFEGIPSKEMKRIEKINLSENELSKEALAKLLGKLTNLKMITVRDNPFGEGGVVELVQSMHCHETPLETLKIADTGVGESDCKQIANLLADGWLQKLNLHRNGLSSKSIACILNGLKQHKTMHKLNLSESHFSEEDCKSLSSYLSKPECPLKNLNISECEINSEGAVCLGRALLTNHVLTTLNLGDNLIGDDGAATLGKALEENGVLRTLHVMRCGITQVGATALAAGLRGNAKLQSLRLDGNCIGEEGARALGEVIAKNCTLKWLYLGDDESLGSGVNWMLERLEENSTLCQLTLDLKYKCLVDNRVEWWQ